MLKYRKASFPKSVSTNFVVHCRSDFSVEDLRIFQCPNTVACTIMYMYERMENKEKG